MSVRQHIYLLLRRMAIPLALFASPIISGCADSTQSAMEKGAEAQAQFEAGQIAKARQTIAKAIEERDDIVDLQLLRARIEFAAGSPAGAFRAYNNALALDASNGEALLGVAEIGLQVGSLRESEAAADHVLTIDPRHPTALLIKGLHNAHRRRFPEALANAESIIASAPADEGAAILKARSLVMLDRPEEALAVAESARTRTGDTRSIAATLLELYRYRGNGPAMVGEQERLRKFRPDEHEVYIDEADTLYKLGDIPRARSILRDLLLKPKLDEESAAAATRLWREYDPFPLDANGVRQLMGKASLAARTAVTHHFLDLNDASRASAALAGAPAVDDMVAMRARIAIAEGKVDEGLRQAERILERDQTHCDALLAKAQASLAKGRGDDAVTASQIAIASCPQLVPAHLALAQAHELNGSRQGANLAFRAAFQRNDQDSVLARIYATWLERVGQSARAVAIARRLTSNAPSLRSGWKLYLDLCKRHPDEGCTADAEAGLGTSQRRFGVDPRTGQRPRAGLFERIS